MANHNTKKELTFEQFKTELLSEIKKRFGLEQNDTRYDDDAYIRADYSEGWSIEDCCEWLQNKDDLDRIDLSAFGM